MELPKYPKNILLESGVSITIRPIKPDDKEKIKQAFSELSQKSRYHRFFMDIKYLSESQLKYLTQINDDHFALAAGISEDRGVAVARYVRLQKELAEVAITVLDDYQNLGIGTILIHELSQIAIQKGIKKFRLFIHPNNKRLIHKIKGQKTHLKFENGVYTTNITVEEVLQF